MQLWANIAFAAGVGCSCCSNNNGGPQPGDPCDNGDGIVMACGDNSSPPSSITVSFNNHTFGLQNISGNLYTIIIGGTVDIDATGSGVLDDPFGVVAVNLTGLTAWRYTTSGNTFVDNPDFSGNWVSSLIKNNSCAEINVYSPTIETLGAELTINPNIFYALTCVNDGNTKYFVPGIYCEIL